MRKCLMLLTLATASLVAAGAALAQDLDIKVPLPPIPKISIPKPPIPKLTIESRGRETSKPIPPGERRRHRYDYHPDAQVYFDPSRQLYFFLQANEWLARAVLPPDLRVRLGSAVTLELDSDRPFDYHDDVRRAYPIHREERRYGYQAGYDNGYDAGYRSGYDQGYRQGYDQGYRQGYRNGRDRERDRGYGPPGEDRGRKEGWGKHDR